jgi:hypothetical protein
MVAALACWVTATPATPRPAVVSTVVATPAHRRRLVLVSVTGAPPFVIRRTAR